MVSFCCDGCNETLKKAKVGFHNCGSRSVSCIDCSKQFFDYEYEAHTSCVSEAEKHQKSMYREKKPKATVKVVIAPQAVANDIEPIKKKAKKVKQVKLDSKAAPATDMDTQATPVKEKEKDAQATPVEGKKKDAKAALVVAIDADATPVKEKKKDAKVNAVKATKKDAKVSKKDAAMTDEEPASAKMEESVSSLAAIGTKRMSPESSDDPIAHAVLFVMQNANDAPLTLNLLLKRTKKALRKSPNKIDLTIEMVLATLTTVPSLGLSLIK